jgi:hypothetical protein
MTHTSIPTVGSYAQVWHGNAKHTAGGLTKSDLMMRNGRIISRAKHLAGKKAFKKMTSATKTLWNEHKIAKKSKSKSKGKK